MTQDNQEDQEHPPEAAHDDKVLAAIQKMQQQLVFLERKLNTILKNLPEKSSEGGYRSGPRREDGGNRFPRQHSNFKHVGPSSKKRHFGKPGSFKPWQDKREGGFKHKHKKKKTGYPKFDR